MTNGRVVRGGIWALPPKRKPGRAGGGSLNGDFADDGAHRSDAPYRRWRVSEAGWTGHALRLGTAAVRAVSSLVQPIAFA